MKHYPIDIPEELHRKIKKYCNQNNFRIKEYYPYLLKLGFERERIAQTFTKVWEKKGK